MADIAVQFPSLAADIQIPDFFEPSKFFSSVFRIASKGVQLWTHYDVCTDHFNYSRCMYVKSLFQNSDSNKELCV